MRSTHTSSTSATTGRKTPLERTALRQERSARAHWSASSCTTSRTSTLVSNVSTADPSCGDRALDVLQGDWSDARRSLQACRQQLVDSEARLRTRTRRMGGLEDDHLGLSRRKIARQAEAQL